MKTVYCPSLYRLSLLTGLLATLLPTGAHALAAREPIAGMSHEECARRAAGKGGYPTIDGSAGVYMIGDKEELCIWKLGKERLRFELPNANRTQSYPRDGLVEYFTLATSPNDDSTMRVKQEVLIPSLSERTPPWRIGQEVIIDLPIHSTQNGQTIYQLNEFVGLRLWASLLEGPLGSFRNNPRRFVNNGKKIGGNQEILGDYFNRDRTDAWNANFNLDAEVVLLKAPSAGQNIIVPEQNIGMVKLHSANYRKISGKIDFPISISAINIRFVPRTCEYRENSERSVKLHTIGIGHFKDRNEVPGGGSVQLHLHCDQGANVDSFVTFTDNSNINNTSNILGLANVSNQTKAENVGLKVYLNESTTPVRFGPIVYNPGTEGSSLKAIKKQDYMQQIGTKSDDAQVHTLNLKANYVRIDPSKPIKPGKANGEMMFTFSYY